VVVSVAPLPDGLWAPLIVTTLLVVGLVAVSETWTWPAHHDGALSIIVVLPAIVLGARLWRWRSQRLVVTTERVLESSGIVNHHVVAVELREVTASWVQQRFVDRVTRRGSVILESPHSAIVLGRLRHPDALQRVIDYQRTQLDHRDRGELERADELSVALDEGLLTNDEYDRRWRRLFGPDGPRGR
jgi:hypothetical protein